MSDLTISILTKDRPTVLAMALTSIYNQDLKPKFVHIIDGGDDPATSTYEIRAIMDILNREGITVIHFREFERNLFKLRAGQLRAADTNFLMFMDDDNILDQYYLSNIMPHAYKKLHGFVAGLNLLPNNEIQKPDYSIELLPDYPEELGCNQWAYFEYEKEIIVTVGYSNITGTVFDMTDVKKIKDVTEELCKFEDAALEDFILTYFMGPGVLVTKAKSWHLMNPNSKRNWIYKLDNKLRNDFKNNPKKVMTLLR